LIARTRAEAKEEAIRELQAKQADPQLQIFHIKGESEHSVKF